MLKKIKAAGYREAEDAVDRALKRAGEEPVELEVYVQDTLAYRLYSDPKKEKPNGSVR